MVRVPSYDNYNILGGNTQQAYSNVQASPDAFGAGVGRATEQLGGALQGFEQQAEHVYKEVKTLDAENRYANETSELFRQADMEYQKAQGKNAVDGYDGAVERVRKIESETLSNISDPFERMQMSQLLTRRRQQSMDAYGRHQANQLEVYDNQTFQGMTATYAQGAIDSYNNPERANWYLKSAEAYIDAHSLKKGEPLEWKNKQIQDLKDNVHSNIANLLMAEDPYKASQYIAENMSNISPAIYSKAVKQLEPYRIEGLANDLIAKAATGMVPKGGQQSIDNSMFEVNKPAAQPPAQYKALFVQKAQQYAVDPNLVMAVAHAENAKYDPSAKSSAGAVGLMQLMPDTARGLKLKDDEFTNPERNVDGGVRHLKRMLTLFNGNKALALAAYNAGEGHLLGYKRKDGTRNIGAIQKAKNKYGASPSIDQIFEFLPKGSETIPYVNKILKDMGESDSTKTPPVTVENTPEKAQETADTPQKKVDNTPLSPSFIANGQFKNLEELNAVYGKAFSAVTGSGYEASQVRNSLTAKYKQQKTFLDDRMKASNNYILSDINKDLANGTIIDLNKKKQDPAWFENFENMTPEGQKNIYDTINDQSKKTTDAFKDESRQRKFDLFTRYGNDREAWNTVDIFGLKLTPDDRNDAFKRQEEVLGNKQDKVLLEDEDLATKIFDGEFTRGTNVKAGFNADGTPRNPIYPAMLGQYLQLIRQYQKKNNNLPTDNKIKRETALDLLSQVNTFTYKADSSELDTGWDYTPDASMQTVGSLLADWSAEGKPLYGEDPQKALDYIKEAKNKGLTLNPLEIKKALKTR